MTLQDFIDPLVSKTLNGFFIGRRSEWSTIQTGAVLVDGSSSVNIPVLALTSFQRVMLPGELVK